MDKNIVVFDSEVYKNFYLVSFMDIGTGKVKHYEMQSGGVFNKNAIRKILKNYKIVTFNGMNYDLPILTAALQGFSCEKLKVISDKIILNNLKYWQLGIEPVKCDHIDLIEVAPGFGSLKIYGGSLHTKTMRDLPYDPDQEIDFDQSQELITYCGNDLRLTAELYKYLKPQIDLRAKMNAQYGIDLRSKSDAQIAEAVVKHEVEKLSGKRLQKTKIVERSFYYKTPSFIEFETEHMNSILHAVEETEFFVKSSGRVDLPKELSNRVIEIGQSSYKMGIGGLHSKEKKTAHIADKNILLIDRDVASYYPSIIINQLLAPDNMGAYFIQVYKKIVQERLKAKRNGDTVTADALKIVINGSFGKFGSPYSILYAPELLIQTTITGQLALLMLIEMLENESIPVVSANTDGVVIKCTKNNIDLMNFIIWEWEERTGFITEETQYKALYSRDVNNYIAIKESGGYKTKGAYAIGGLAKNPTNTICVEAVIAYLREGLSIRDTILNCEDITKFVTIRTVKGGAVDQSGNYLGKAIRWYYAKGVDGCLSYKVNGYKVPKTDNAKPLMTLPNTLPRDIDYDWYIDEANSILKALGGG